MPAVVQTYVDTNNIQDIFDLIPAELNSKNKRFILKNLNENIKFNRYEDSFIWLREAGVALPTYFLNCFLVMLDCLPASKRQGELDFVIKLDDEIVPIEVKSGKDYERHNALQNVVNYPDYEIKNAYVLCNDNLKVSGKITYIPIYMVMFIQNSLLPSLIYKGDLTGL